LAYVPQILCVSRDRTGAASVSLMTWGLFCLANVTTVFYGLSSGDRVLAGIFLLNAIGCVIIVALILEKRIKYRELNGPARSGQLQMRSTDAFSMIQSVCVALQIEPTPP
jgi:hypothetical protein